MMITNSVFGLLVIAVVVWAVVRLTSSGRGTGDSAGSAAREILDRRLAAGEIDVGTHRAAVRELTAGHGG